MFRHAQVRTQEVVPDVYLLLGKLYGDHEGGELGVGGSAVVAALLEATGEHGAGGGVSVLSQFRTNTCTTAARDKPETGELQQFESESLCDL